MRGAVMRRALVFAAGTIGETEGQRVGGDRAALPVALFPIARNAALAPAFFFRLPLGPKRKPLIVPARGLRRLIPSLFLFRAP